MFVLFSCGLNIILEIVGIDILGLVVSLALFVPSIALGARRLHDTGKSGWWQLLCLIPIVGWIVIIVFWAQETTSSDNQYGVPATPKVPVSATVVVAPTAAPVNTMSAESPIVRDADVEVVVDKTQP